MAPIKHVVLLQHKLYPVPNQTVIAQGFFVQFTRFDLRHVIVNDC